MRHRSFLRCQGGQANVEFVAIVPALLLACAIAWQLVIAGQTAWLAAHAARAGARAAAVGADTGAAARSALPRSMREGLSVAATGGSVHVRLAVPILVRAWRSPVRVDASAALVDGS